VNGRAVVDARLIHSPGLTSATRAGSVWLIVIGLCLVGRSLVPGFLTVNNLGNIVALSSIVGVAAVGVTFVMVAGEIDVSVAAVATISAVVAGVIMAGRADRIALAVCVVLGFGAAVGTINGVMVALGVQSFILTLAVAVLLLGGVQLYTGGTALGDPAPEFLTFMRDRHAGIPTTAFILIAAVIIGAIVLRYTRLGARAFLVGANARTAHASGVRTSATIVALFALSGLFAALAGLVLLGRSGVPNDFKGMGIEFQALAAVVIGGTSFEGGRGTMLGTLAGVLILGLSLNLVIFLGLPYGGQLLVKGLFIVSAGLVYALFNRHKS
jgi:ribose/xylose/arabinose/galactoside ABC-type transport system permease subunit